MFTVEIVVKGWIDREWCDWLGGLTITHYAPDLSILCGELPDRAAAYGIIARMRDLGFQFSSVRIEVIEQEN